MLDTKLSFYSLIGYKNKSLNTIRSGIVVWIRHGLVTSTLHGAQTWYSTTNSCGVLVKVRHHYWVLGVHFFSAVFLLQETKYLLCLFSSLRIIFGTLSFVFSVEPFAYFGSQMPSCLKNRKYLQQVLSFSQFIYVAWLLQQRPIGFLVLSGCKKGTMDSRKIIK